MNIYLGADHNGYAYKQQIGNFLLKSGYEVMDDGDTTLNLDDDFPQFAARVAHSLLADKDPQSRGILICGSGQGMCMAANRFWGIRASLCWNLDEARTSRNDDDSNILCLSARNVSIEKTQAIITAWLSTPFAAAPRFIRRLAELDQLI